MWPDKGQVSFEYIVIVGLVLLFLIPLWAYISGVQEGASSQLSITYAQNTVEKLASNADLVFSQGPPAKITTTIYIPPGVESTSINGSTIIIRLWVEGGLSDISTVSNANITGSLPKEDGNYKVVVEAVSNYVTFTVL